MTQSRGEPTRESTAYGAAEERSGLSNVELIDLYRNYGYLLLRRSRSVLRDRQLAQDVLHNVFEKLMRHGSGVREADSPLGWLNRVADRCCFDLIARKQRERLALTAVSAPDSATPAVETRSVLTRLLSHLEPKDRLLAQLLYGDGSSQGDVSKRLGWSRQTVNKHAARIRRLAQQLALE